MNLKQMWPVWPCFSDSHDRYTSQERTWVICVIAITAANSANRKRKWINDCTSRGTTTQDTNSVVRSVSVTFAVFQIPSCRLYRFYLFCFIFFQKYRNAVNGLTFSSTWRWNRRNSASLSKWRLSKEKMISFIDLFGFCVAWRVWLQYSRVEIWVNNSQPFPPGPQSNWVTSKRAVCFFFNAFQCVRISVEPDILQHP